MERVPKTAKPVPRQCCTAVSSTSFSNVETALCWKLMVYFASSPS
jgi:hypothetical protein